MAYEITAALAVGMLLLERGLNARESGLLVGPAHGRAVQSLAERAVIRQEGQQVVHVDVATAVHI